MHQIKKKDDNGDEVLIWDKTLIYGTLNGDYIKCKLEKKAKDTFAIYGSSVFAIQEAIDRQETVFYTEGEKDVNTLMEKGYTAVTCGGSGDWKSDASILFQNANVIVLADNDKPGGKLASTVVKDLKGIVKSIKIIVPMTNKWKWAGERIAQIISEMIRNTERSLEGLAREMKSIGTRMGNNLANGISNATSGITRTLNNVVGKVNSTIGNINSSLSGIERAFSFSYDVTGPTGNRRWGYYNMSLPRVNTIPYLAKGAVIPPRSEFLAVLGDQKQGNNIEAPEALLRKIVREESGGQQSGGNVRFTAQINRRTVFDEIIEEAKLRRDTSGRNPFELA